MISLHAHRWGKPDPKPEKAAPKVQTMIPKKTKKQAAKEREMQTVITIIRQNRPAVCEGCGIQNPLLLDASHLASRKHYPELMAHPRNIRLHCRTCHNKWEGDIPGRELMLDYKPNMAYLETAAPDFHQRLLNKQAA